MNPQYRQAAALLTKDDLAILQDELVGRKGGNAHAPSRRPDASQDSAQTGSPSQAGPTAMNPGKRRGQTGKVASSSPDNPAPDSAHVRQYVTHDWPLAGAVLTAEYYGQQYRAVVIPAQKKLLSGRQLRIESGPATGEICDSLSAAMIAATEAQRQKMKLHRKGVANGWDFWQWEGK